MSKNDFKLEPQAETLLHLFIKHALEKFPNRIISIYKFGSLGTHGGFSLCSDVDVALFLDEIKDTDYKEIENLCSHIKASNLEYADRLSVFWSSYDNNTFTKGFGRFPALDRLDLIMHGILIYGEDKKDNLKKPTHQEMVLESAQFISSFMLSGEKVNQLIHQPEIIANMGARYFTKFVLFPVRLLFTLAHPDIIGSNHDAVEYFNKALKELLPKVSDLVNFAYKARNHSPYQPININSDMIKHALLPLYLFCIEQYYKAVLELGNHSLATQLENEKERLFA